MGRYKWLAWYILCIKPAFDTPDMMILERLYVLDDFEHQQEFYTLSDIILRPSYPLRIHDAAKFENVEIWATIPVMCQDLGRFSPPNVPTERYPPP